jgi:hypothetical protein
MALFWQAVEYALSIACHSAPETMGAVDSLPIVPGRTEVVEITPPADSESKTVKFADGTSKTWTTAVQIRHGIRADPALGASSVYLPKAIYQSSRSNISSSYAQPEHVRTRMDTGFLHFRVYGGQQNGRFQAHSHANDSLSKMRFYTTCSPKADNDNRKAY